MIKLKSLGLLGFGFVIGAVIVGGPVWWRSSVMFRDQYFSQLLEVTSNASMVRAGHANELVKNAEASIRQCVPAANSLWGDHEARVPSFRYAQRYYERFNLEVPAELKPIFAALPPAPARASQNNSIADTVSGQNEAEHEDSNRPAGAVD